MLLSEENDGTLENTAKYLNSVLDGIGDSKSHKIDGINPTLCDIPGPFLPV
jgi:hypothetical protein